MKSQKLIDREIKLAANFVNSFPRYDPANRAQILGFAVMEALEWARGRRVSKPSERWPPLMKIQKMIADSGMTAQEFAAAYNGPEGDAIADAKRKR